MVIKNNNAAARTLHELNRNVSALGKQLQKVSSGQRIGGAGDDASGYSISERMRVRIRALDQDERNVQNGASLLRVAEGGIQSQIEIMKTIKQKVIDADNDTNTDIDRATIQKEIDQGYRQIEDIAWETTYNGKRLLVGDTVGETIRSWIVNGTSSLLPGSDEMRMIDLNMIADNYDTLNGIVGPFDLFTHSAITSTNVDTLGFSPTIEFKGGTDPVFTIDSSYTTPASLDGTAFSLTSSNTTYGTYVLRDGVSNAHLYGVVTSMATRTDYVQEIDISGCNTIAEVMARIDEQVTDITGHGENYFSATRDIVARSITGYEIYLAGADEVSTFSGTQYLSGGKNAIGDPNDVDSNYQPAEYATMELPGIAAGMGLTIDASGYTSRVRFIEGDSAPSAADGVTTVGVDYSGTFSTMYVNGTMEGRNLTLSASFAGATGNGYRITSGIAETNLKYWGATALKGTLASNTAYATVDVSAYGTDVERLIADLTGKAIALGYSRTDGQSALFENGYPYDSKNYVYYEFVDSASDNPVDRMNKIANSNVKDLNSLRASVEAGKSVAQAFLELFYPTYGRIKEATDSGGNVIGARFFAYQEGASSNGMKLFLAQNNLRSYTLDYGKWFEENPGVSIPDFLNDKGFRVYCATCANQWFNFHFVTEELPEGRPLNADPESEDIKDIYINVAGVTDAESLVQVIYDQAMPSLTGESTDHNHFMRLIADGDKLIVYDERRNTDSYLKNVPSSDYDYQWDDTYGVGGAKIADGVWDNVEIGELDRYVKELVIHHTDHASQNIHLKIPQTTMDHLFGYQAGTREWSEFNVMTATSREELLGNKAGVTRSGGYAAEDEKGLLDMALDYLTGANTLVGAQIMRLEMTEANIVTARESTTASESAVRDADMAKEMTEYTKANVLLQAAQSMLAQANQSSSGVLSLLQ